MKNKFQSLRYPVSKHDRSLNSLAEQPGLKCPRPVEELQSDLIEALRLDLKHNHPKDRLLLPKLLVLIPDFVQIVEEFCENLKVCVFDRSPAFGNTKPLLREIFDLC